jgi:hypothetical protein
MTAVNGCVCVCVQVLLLEHDIITSPGALQVAPIQHIEKNTKFVNFFNRLLTASSSHLFGLLACACSSLVFCFLFALCSFFAAIVLVFRLFSALCLFVTRSSLILYPVLVSLCACFTAYSSFSPVLHFMRVPLIYTH